MESEVGPQAAVNVVIAPAALEGYFRSIENPFQETRLELAGSKSPIGLFALLFLFSLIPVFPYLLSKFIFLLFGSFSIGFHGFRFPISSFWFWWVVLFGASLSNLMFVRNLFRPSTQDRERWLSPQQMRFAYCYGAVDEIRKYRTNRLGRHIDEALDDLTQIGAALMRASTPDLAEGVYPYHYWQSEAEARGNEEGLHRSVGIRLERPKWYRLQPETETIIRAFQRFLPRLRDRLKDRKDLVAIESALTDLAGYLYTEIPELSDSSSQSAYEKAGMESLLRFAQKINDLARYRSEPIAQTSNEKASEKLLTLGLKLSTPFSHENVLVSFCAWYALLLILFSAGFYVAFRYVPTLKVDTTVVATLVGGPVATAVTAVAIPRLTKARK